MRLIDADELEIDEIDGVRCYSILQVDEALTVQAVPIDVLDKIRAELHATAEMHEDGDYYLCEEWIDGIIDKYKAESEDKE